MKKTEIEDAIAAHRAWIELFRLAISSSDAQKIDVAAAADFTHCGLGGWLSANKGMLLNPPFCDLKTQHIAFHFAAATVARLINEGADKEAISIAVEKVNGLSEHIIAVLQRLVVALR